MSHLNATLWYIEYQTLVFQVPLFGIPSTKHWYFKYPTLVFKIVSIEFVFDSDDKILVVTVYVPCRHR